MWRKEYLACIKNNLFIIVQICLALVLINYQVGNIIWMVERLSGIEDTDKNTYFYQYAMAAGGVWDGMADYEEVCEKIRSFPGIEDMGETFDFTVSVEEGSVKKTDEEEVIQLQIMDSIVTAAVTYRMEEGRWLTESDRDGEEIHVVLGGEIAKRHKIGDRISVELEHGLNYEMEVVGKLPENCWLVDMNTLTADQRIDSFMQPDNNDIYVNHEKVFSYAKAGGFGRSNANCIVKLQKDADKEYLSDYGKLVSFKEMEQDTEKELHDYVKEIVEENMMWVVVIVFGIIATSYLMGKKRRYVWGIYLLLGEKPEQLLKMLMKNNAINYIIGVIAGLFIYQIYPRDEISPTGIGRYHIIVDAVFILIMLIISLLSNAYIMKLEPKEILTQTKE